jgi:hypothetical protein
MHEARVESLWGPALLTDVKLRNIGRKDFRKAQPDADTKLLVEVVLRHLVGVGYSQGLSWSRE